MLVLSRKVGESIMINDEIEVVIVKIKGNKAMVGIKAPLETMVHRREVFDEIKRGREDK